MVAVVLRLKIWYNSTMMLCHVFFGGKVCQVKSIQKNKN